MSRDLAIGWLSLTKTSSCNLTPGGRRLGTRKRLNWAAYSHRRDNAFLSHLRRSTSLTKQSRAVRSRTMPVERQTPTKAFPEEHFELLVCEGFRRRSRGSRGPTDLRNVLITYLMHYGGLRLSEALSRWSDDVSLEAGEVIVPFITLNTGWHLAVKPTALFTFKADTACNPATDWSKRLTRCSSGERTA